MCIRDSFEKQLITEEEARGYMNVFTSLTRNEWVLEQRRRKGTHGTTLSDAPGGSGERRGLALAANSGTMVDDMLIILLHVGNHINIIGLRTAQAFQRASRSRGQDIKKLNLTKRPRVSGAGHGVCDRSLQCKTACEEKGDPAGKPA
eukprot:295636-Pyramimonas_sp.AAC.1